MTNTCPVAREDEVSLAETVRFHGHLCRLPSANELSGPTGRSLLGNTGVCAALEQDSMPDPTTPNAVSAHRAHSFVAPTLYVCFVQSLALPRVVKRVRNCCL